MFRFPCGYLAAIVVFTAFLAVALLSKPVDAQSDVDSANYVLPACKQFIARSNNLGTALREGQCVGMIEGLSYTAWQLTLPEMRSCSPKDVTKGQAVRVVVAYIERRPQRMHENFKELALEALRDAWSCR